MSPHTLRNWRVCCAQMDSAEMVVSRERERWQAMHAALFNDGGMIPLRVGNTSHTHLHRLSAAFGQMSRGPMRHWFNTLFGFDEIGVTEGNWSHESYLANQSQFTVVSDAASSTNKILKSNVNGREFAIGTFSTPTLASLRSDALASITERHAPSIRHEAITDVFRMHGQNERAVFQAASQFNCLEFPSPETTPERGVTGYAYDETQGPACALACAAGTIYRNYFTTVASNTGSGEVTQAGQTKDCQLNNLDMLEDLLDNVTNRYWRVDNGYTFSNADALGRLNTVLEDWRLRGDWHKLESSIKVGLHSDVGVTFESRFKEISHDVRVTQVYCSALSCAYSGVGNTHWEKLARLVLNANYEATIWAAVLNRNSGGSKTVYLTFLGGGVFGNEPEWIASAIGTAVAKATIAGADIDVVICHYRKVNTYMETLILQAYETELSNSNS